jgi:glycosyltransferase 2 family protein
MLGLDARRRWHRDWRVWLGVAITAVCLWLALRGVPFGEVWSAVRGANMWLLFGVSIPAYVVNIYFRALRWRYLTDPIARLKTRPLFDAQAVGFALNNLFPLRVGEVVRSWYLARAASASTAAVLGTVILERVIDTACVIALVAFALLFAGLGRGETNLLTRGALALLPVAVAPLLALAAMKRWPDAAIRMAGWFTRPLPEPVSERVASTLRNFTEGLGALEGGWHLFWLAFHSAQLWLFWSVLPMLATVMAFGVDLGGPLRTLALSWLLLAVVGVAIALPSAPGFIGPYQLAFKLALGTVGVDPATAVAMGMAAWAAFWVSLTVPGLIVLRVRHTSLQDLGRDPGKDPAAARR